MTSALEALTLLLLRSAARGAAVAAVVAAVIEALVVGDSVNAVALSVVALAAKTYGRPLWWGAAAYGLVVVALGSESVWPAVLFWGAGFLVESISRLLPRISEA